MPQPLSLDDVRHVARLARLRLDAAQLERYRVQLSTVLDHLATLAALDLEDVEPMAHPLEMTNRLGDDCPEPPLPAETFLAGAPAALAPYLAVPRVIGES